MEPNTTQTPNYLFDTLLNKPLTLAELKIVLAVVRETYGWGESNWEMSIGDLVKKTGLERSNVVRAAARLSMGSDRLPAILGRKQNKAGIYVYWLLIEKKSVPTPVKPEVVSQRHQEVVSQRHQEVVSQRHQSKEETKFLKPKKKKVSPSSSVPTREQVSKTDDDDTKSIFGIEIVRQYVMHLVENTDRKIRNPEGLALSMFQTGVDDSKISAWLEQTVNAPVAEDPYALFRRIVGLSMDLAKLMKKDPHFDGDDHRQTRQAFLDSGAITHNDHYSLMCDLALIRLQYNHLGLPDDVIEAKRKEFRKAG